MIGHKMYQTISKIHKDTWVTLRKSYESLNSYMLARGFELLRGKKATSLGCHEMVFLSKEKEHQ